MSVHQLSGHPGLREECERSACTKPRIAILQTENERLREALWEIRDAALQSGGGPFALLVGMMSRIYNIALHALGDGVKG